MRILEHVDRVIVLDDGSEAARALCGRLAAAGSSPAAIDLASREGWRSRMYPLLETARLPAATGVLVLAPAAGDDRELWRSQDRMIERLEWRRWEIAFLGHGDGADRVPADLRPDLIECDAVPAGLSAIALRWATLRSAVELMPDRAVDGPLAPTEWLTILAWLVQPPVCSSRPLFAWPPLLRPGGPERAPAGARSIA